MKKQLKDLMGTKIIDVINCRHADATLVFSNGTKLNVNAYMVVYEPKIKAKAEPKSTTAKISAIVSELYGKKVSCFSDKRKDGRRLKYTIHLMNTQLYVLNNKIKQFGAVAEIVVSSSRYYRSQRGTVLIVRY